MNPEPISLPCRPGLIGSLRRASVPTVDGRVQETLVGVNNGEKFLIRDGIPLFLDESNVSGFKQRYQVIYNRIAGLYDADARRFAYLAGEGEEHFRVSISTNWRYRTKVVC